MKKILLLLALLSMISLNAFSKKERYYADGFQFSRIKDGKELDEMIDNRMRDREVPITIDYDNKTIEVHSIHKDKYEMKKFIWENNMGDWRIRDFECTDLCGEKCTVSLYFNKKRGRIGIITVGYTTRRWGYFIDN